MSAKKTRSALKKFANHEICSQHRAKHLENVVVSILFHKVIEHVLYAEPMAL